MASGVRVVGERDARAETVALGFFVMTGARDEAPASAGASHLIEHLLFKGSAAMPGGELNARLDDLGASVNAYTGEETTVYHAACLPPDWPALLKLLGELLRPAFRPRDVQTEREVVLEEIAMYADDPGSRAFDELRRRAWNGHPLGHLVLGTPETLANLTPEVLRHDFAARYGAQSVVLAACGDFDWGALLAAAEDLTAGWPAGTFGRALSAPTFAPALHLAPQADLARVQFALLAPGLAATDPLREAAAVLAELLGGDNGRLHWSLVDAGLADGFDLSHAEFQELGAFEAGWSCDPSRAGETLDIVRGELQALQREGPTPAELARARNKLATQAALGAETPYARLFALGEETLYLGHPRTLEESVAAFERVTLNGVRTVLEGRPFDKAQILALGPLNSDFGVAPT